MRLLIFIPCFNEASSISNVINSLPKDLDGISEIDCLVVDDGSTDNTFSIAKNCKACVIQHHRNRGLGVAFRTGVDWAIKNKYDIMLNIDGDGQFNSDQIKDVIQPILLKEAEFVTGSRFMNISKSREISNMPKVKFYGNILMSSFVSGLMGQKFCDVSCGFRAYSYETLCKLNLNGDFTYTQETFIQLGASGCLIKEVPVDVEYFQNRKSRVAGSIFKYAINSLRIILNVYRNYYILRVFLFVAFLFFSSSVIFTVYALSTFLQTGSFSGSYFAVLISVGSFLMSVVLCLFGIAFEQFSSVRRSVDEVLCKIRQL